MLLGQHSLREHSRVFWLLLVLDLLHIVLDRADAAIYFVKTFGERILLKEHFLHLDHNLLKVLRDAALKLTAFILRHFLAQVDADDVSLARALLLEVFKIVPQVLNAVLNLLDYIATTVATSSHQSLILDEGAKFVVQRLNLLCIALNAIIHVFHSDSDVLQFLFDVLVIGIDQLFIFDDVVFDILDLEAHVGNLTSELAHVFDHDLNTFLRYECGRSFLQLCDIVFEFDGLKRLVVNLKF